MQKSIDRKLMELSDKVDFLELKLKSIVGTFHQDKKDTWKFISELSVEVEKLKPIKK